MTFAQKLAGRSTRAIDDPTPRYRGARSNRFVPTDEMHVFLDGKELVRTIYTVKTAGVPRPDRHICDRIFGTGEELMRRQVRVQDVQLTFGVVREAEAGMLQLSGTVEPFWDQPDPLGLTGGNGARTPSALASPGPLQKRR